MTENNASSTGSAQPVTGKATTLEMVKYEDLITNNEAWAYRDDEDYSTDDKSIVALAESIRTRGQIEPLRGKRDQGKVLVVEGHRRHAAMGLLVKAGNWTPQTTVKVLIYDDSQNEDDILLEIGTINQVRKDWPDGGRIRYATRLSNRGVPMERICAAVGKSAKQVGRYVMIGNCPWMMKFMKDHVVNATAASKLLEAASKEMILALGSRPSTLDHLCVARHSGQKLVIEIGRALC